MFSLYRRPHDVGGYRHHLSYQVRWLRRFTYWKWLYVHATLCGSVLITNPPLITRKENPSHVGVIDNKDAIMGALQRETMCMHVM